jgi:PAS domain S-box-containing protein
MEPEQALSSWPPQPPAFYWATDRDLTITASLGSGLADRGLAPDQLAGTRLADYLGTSDPESPTLAAHLRALQGESISYEQEWTGRTYRVRVEPRRAEGGAVEGCVCLAVDVTEQRRAERRLRAQYAVTHALAEATTAADAAARVLQAVCEGLGWDLGALWVIDRGAWVLRCAETWHAPGQDVADFLAVCRRFAPGHGVALPGRVWEQAAPVWVEDVAADPQSPRAPVAVRLGLHAAAAFPVLRGPDVLGVLEFFSRAIRPPDDDLMQLMAAVGAQVGHFLERRRQDEALLAGEERYRRITETAAEGIVTLDPDGKVTFANGRMARLLGHPVEEMMGRSLLDFVHPEDRAAAAARLRHTRQGYEEQGDLRFRTRDGKTLWALVATVPLPDDARGQAGTLAMVTDVTARRELEARYLQAQKMEAVGRLAGGIAHDFNNLLTIISGCGELLARGLLPGSDAADLVREIREAGDRAAVLTRQLLTFSRKQPLVVEVLDLNEVVGRVQRMLRRILGEDIEQVVTQESALGRVNADPGQIEQVIVNLAVNARDAMPDGGTFMLRTANAQLDEDYARLRPGVRPGWYVLLAVSDTGCGMDEQTRLHLFEPFFTTKAPEKGTGLGLATVYGIVQQSGGHIDLHSEPGRGTTFNIYLPRSKASLSPEERALGQSMARGGAETVLVVEDEEAVRSVMRRALEGAGYTVLEARGGAEAVRLAEQYAGPIHLVLTDVVMPGLNGRQVAERVTALRPGTRVLFVSGYTDDAVARHGVQGEGLAFLQKPFMPDALARKVREVLDANR